MRVTMFLFVMWATLPAVAAPPPLSAPEREQVRSGTQDRSPYYDDAGLYPLLTNAAWWKAGDEAGAAVPDYEGLLRPPTTEQPNPLPDESRGNLFLIEGQLAAPPSDVGELSRPGPWDGRLQHWNILVRRDPDLVAVVLLLDPPNEWDRPRVGQRVRLPARFYKIWRDRNGEDFPVFVGKTLSGVSSAGSSAASPSSPGGSTVGMGAMMLLFGVLVVAGLFYFMLKKRAAEPLGVERRRQERAQREQAQREQRRRGQTSDEEEEDWHPPLPEDPTEALRELERRKDQDDE